MVIGHVTTSHTLERDMLIKNIVSLVKEYPPVRPKKKIPSGKKPIHSWEKLVCICILMVVFGSTYRNIQNVVFHLIYPGTSHIQIILGYSVHFKNIPLIYLECILLSSVLSMFERIRLAERHSCIR